MAVIKQLFDNTINDKIYPVTHINAVLDNNGNNIADLLEGAGSLVVNFTFDDGEEAFTADQTQSAILDAYESGKVVFGKILPSDPSSMLSPGQIFQLSRIEAYEGGYIFFSHLSELEISANLSCGWGDIYYYPSQTALAPTSSPSFVGTPTAPTPSASSNNNSIATTAFVKNALENVQVTTDATLDDASENPVQNKVISSRIANIEKVTAESLNDLEERKIDASVADVRYQAAGEYATSSDLAAKADLVEGKVPASQLPSFVDDVIEGTMSNGTFTPSISGANVQETGKLYVDTGENRVYRWTGSAYAEVASSQTAGLTRQVSVTPSASVTIDPYKLNDFGTVSSSVAVSFDTTKEVAGFTREYMIRLVAGSGCAVSLPVGTLYANGQAPTFTEGRTYEIDVVNGCAVVGEFF